MAASHTGAIFLDEVGMRDLISKARPNERFVALTLTLTAETKQTPAPRVSGTTSNRSRCVRSPKPSCPLEFVPTTYTAVLLGHTNIHITHKKWYRRSMTLAMSKANNVQLCRTKQVQSAVVLWVGSAVHPHWLKASLGMKVPRI